MKKICIVGVGYVGLPLALEFSKYFDVVAFDTNEKRINNYNKGINVIEIDQSINLDELNIQFTHNVDDISDCNIYIITVPTPINKYRIPEMKFLEKASHMVGKHLNKGDYVIYESTVYPYATKDFCVPILEAESKLKAIEEFKYGYSPERISPGINSKSVTDIVKIVSGCDEESTKRIEELYKTIITAGVFVAKNVETAEAAKITENIQRDVNIALMNELNITYDKMGIDIREVIDAASTKWNFIKLNPGLVGGHCLGEDPYYLLHKAKEFNTSLSIIESSRETNETFYKYYVDKILNTLLGMNIPSKPRVLFLGLTYKENVNDFRNTKVMNIINALDTYDIETCLVDDYIDKDDFMMEYNREVITISEAKQADLVVVSQAHDIYKELDQSVFDALLKNPKTSVIIDIKNIVSDKIKGKFNVYNY